MAKATRKLTARGVAAVTEPGRHSDGDGLYLQVGASGAKSWLFMFKRDGKRPEIGLGSLRDVSLAEARQKTAEMRKIVADGGDPRNVKKAREEAQRAAKAKPKFGAFADELMHAIEGGFKNEKHRAQWRMTLGDSYCSSIRDKALDEISTEQVVAILQPIWLEKNETASRLRGRIERVLDAAKAKGLRHGENPARWRGHLDTLLPKRQKLQRGHHPAMPYTSVPRLVARLHAAPSISALALEFTILAASRTGESIGARWDEIDIEKMVWTIPATRMKAGREHRVPLTDRMLAILDAVRPLRNGHYVFPGRDRGKPLSNMAMLMLVRRMTIENVTVHGFRSSLKDWAGDETPFAREVAEAALSHAVGDAVEQAYRRGDALEKRRKMMAAWEEYCLASAAKLARVAEPPEVRAKPELACPADRL